MFKSNENNDSCNCQFHPAVVHHTAMRDIKKRRRNDVAAHERCIFTAVTIITHQKTLFYREGMFIIAIFTTA